jgi:diacylglycerol kinase (ATP)
MAEPMNPITRRIRAFGYAIAGLAFVFRSQHAMWVHGSAALCVVIAGFFLGVTPQDWRWLVLGIALVWGAEAMNTAVEMACDAISQDHHPLIGKAKDAAAGAVLVAAIAAVIIGALVFWPYVF